MDGRLVRSELANWRMVSMAFEGRGSLTGLHEPVSDSTWAAMGAIKTPRAPVMP